MIDHSASKDSIRRRVLVVDDEFINRQILGHIVSRDYDVLYAENGVEALEIIKEKKDTISLILLDLLMPVMDGYELLSTIQADAELKRIPVIVLTAEKTAEVKCLKLGAVDFIPKPYDMPDVILARVGRSIELAEDNMIIDATENDIISGLYTRQYFYRYSERHDAYFPDVPMDAVVLNINRFHIINDINGRAYSDSVLKIIGAQIRELLEDKSGIACRGDADNFYIYLEHRDNYGEILRTIKDGVTEKTGNDHIHIRMGVYSNADSGIPVEQRFDRAFRASVNLKTGYRSDYSIYDDSMHEKELFSERLISDMDQAISEKQFKVFYQPKYNIKGDVPVLSSAEALIRWIHPELGFISPGAFIPLFEDNGLIHKLDKFVWHEAASQIKKWKEKYNRTVPVSVNVSRVDLFDPNLKNVLTEIVNEFDIGPDEFLLEITESSYTDKSNSKHIVETVKELREMGFQIEMDDFGSGYSSLNMLTSMPIDALKLDMAFVRNICASEKDHRMIKLMIDIADFLSVPVIAEGVEYEEQYKLLKEAGCDVIQGYYFSKPVPPADFEGLIEKDILRSQNAE